MSFKVDFFIVGQPKSGTTALAKFLNDHPQISMSDPKEPAYFATDLMAESDRYLNKPTHFKFRKLDEYSRIFSNVKKSKILGEASTNYLYSKEAAKNIYKFNPNAKIIIMLREPVSFMRSLHNQYLNEGREDEFDFIQALKLEADRKKWKHLPRNTVAPSYFLYTEQAKYFQQVKRYYELFPKDQILVLIMEEFKNDNKKYYTQVLKFLDVQSDNNHLPNFKTVHGAQSPRSITLNNLLNRQGFKDLIYKFTGQKFYTRISKFVAKLMMSESARHNLSPAIEKRLKRENRSEVEKIGKLVGRDLTTIWDY